MANDHHTYDHVLSFALEHPWALTRPMVHVVAGLLARRLAGEEMDQATIVAALLARNHRVASAMSTMGTLRDLAATVVIPVYGVIAPRINLLSDMSGGATFEGLSARLGAAMADPRITTILFDVDSPGGNVAGATEFSREVFAARSKKRIIAVAHHLMASAAYWAMAGATEIIATPSAFVGSIGVYTIHDDMSEALAKLGVKREVFAAGKYKAEGVDGGPLSDAAKAHIRQLISTSFGRMVADIAKGRGVSATAVREGFGEGHLLDSGAAQAAGLINRVGTLDEVLGQVGTKANDAAMAAHRETLTRASLAMHQQALDALRRVQ